MNNESSCLVKKLSHYISLREQDEERLAEIEKSERSYDAGSDIYSSGDASSELFVVKHGWLFSYVLLTNGSRQIVKLHQPGDIIGFPDIAMKNMTTSLTAAEDVVLCPFPKSALDRILSESPRLSALLLSIALRDQVIFIDLLQAMGRMSAQQRLTYMLLDLAARLRITKPDMGQSFRLPLNQSQIGDYLGLTNVTISKTFHQLERQKILVRRSNMISFVDEKSLARESGFEDRYSDMDTSWFPSAN